MDFKKSLKERKILFEQNLKSFMPDEEGLCKTLYESMNYSLKAGGKRLRPILLLETYKLFGGKESERIMPFAAAIEMIHTYSLIHDDLPSMDDDDLRRGKPTNHKIYGEGIAVLAGDGLLNEAFEIMVKASLNLDDKESALIAMNHICEGSGTKGMIAGQVVDLESENKDINIDVLKYIHENKTGKLILKPMLAGAVLAGASKGEIDNVKTYAKNIGQAFQVMDDILDIVGDQDKLGKNIGSDEENNKATYPSLFGLEKSKEIANELIEDAKLSLKKLNKEDEFLLNLADYIVNRDY